MSDRSLMLAKVEGTYGTDSTPVAVNAIWAENVQYAPAGQTERGAPSKPGVGQVAGVLYGQHAVVSFDVPLAASGTAGTAPKWGPLMKSCGWAETVVAVTSVTYGLAADPQAADSQTLIWSDGRRLHKVLGWRGRVGFAMRGKRPVLTFAGRGLYVPVTTRALPAHADATWTGWYDCNPIANGRSVFTFDAVAMALRDLSITPSDNVIFNDLPGTEAVTLRGPRTFTGSLRVSTPLPSAYNFETAWEAQTIKTWSLVHESTGGKICTLNGKSQVGEPAYSDDRGEDVVQVGLTQVPSTLALDDEFSIVLT